MIVEGKTPKAPIFDAGARVRPRPKGCPIPLTTMQRYVWKHSLRLGRQYGASLRIVGELNEPLLRRCIDIVVARHEALRTRIVLTGETATQEVIDAPDASFEIIDLRAQSAPQASAIAARLALEFFEAHLDWRSEPLFSTRLLRVSDADHVLLVGVDHMVIDGPSLGIVRREIATLYRQGARDAHQRLPPPSVQFGDYAVWQQQTFDSWRSLHEQYWREHFARTPRFEFPFDRAEQEEASRRWTMARLALGKDLTSSLRLIGLKERMIFPLLVLGLITAALSRWCNQSAWAVDVTSHGRHNHPELSNTVGWLTTTLQLHFEIEKEDRLIHVLERIHQEYATAIEHHDHGRLPDCMPLPSAPISFNWPSTPWQRAPASAKDAGTDDVDITPFVMHRSRGELNAPFRHLGFLLQSDDAADSGAVFGMIYQEGLLAARTLEKLSDTIRLAAEAFAADPLVKQGALELVR